MTTKIKKSELFGTTIKTLVLGGIGYFLYEIYKTNYILNHVFDSSLLNKLIIRTSDASKFCSYIYINNEKYSKSLLARLWQHCNIFYSNRLFKLTQCDNRQYRLRAVKSLAYLNGLEDWDYDRLAQMCDARTAVSLARIEHVDQRLFLKPPTNYVCPKLDDLIKHLKNFIITLDVNSKHPCLPYSLEKIFQDKSKIVDNDSTSMEVHKGMQNTKQVLIDCLKCILHHTTLNDYSRDIVKCNGLPLLMEIHQTFSNSDDISTILVQIISNISIHTEYLSSLFQAGWIGVLAKWIKHSNILLSTYAAQALANLDIDGRSYGKYSQTIYLLYPIFRKSQQSEIDVVLVHGLLGGVFFTWRQRDSYVKTEKNIKHKVDIEKHFNKSSDHNTVEFLKDLNAQKQSEWDSLDDNFEILSYDSPESDNQNDKDLINSSVIIKNPTKNDNDEYSHCWPRDWLPKDCNKLRIVGVNYETNLSFWTPMCPIIKLKRTLNERSEEVMKQLLMAGVGKRPIVWVTHSMGGLLVKNILVKAKESNNDVIKTLCDNTKGIVFYSTPHHGTKLAAIKQPTAMVLWPSVEVQELRENSPVLLDLHSKFLNLLNEFPIKIISFLETKSTIVSPMKFNFRFVDKISADPGIGEFYEIPQDHLGICKPANRDSFLYQKVVNLIKCTKSSPESQNSKNTLI